MTGRAHEGNRQALPFRDSNRPSRRYNQFAMPMYEYICKKCDEKFEKLVRSMSDESRPACPKCNSQQTARTMSVFAAVGKDSAAPASAPGCGRCGGPGPCGFG